MLRTAVPPLVALVVAFVEVARVLPLVALAVAFVGVACLLPLGALVVAAHAAFPMALGVACVLSIAEALVVAARLVRTVVKVLEWAAAFAVAACC
jgi:hypothetical protein